MLADPTAPEIDIRMAITAIVAVAAILAVITVILKFWVRRMSLPCQFCRNVRVSLFRELPPDVQTSILSYFREYERREPDAEGLFVCRDCKTVFDDFSGEKMSREVDAIQPRHICKVCNVLMTNCGIRNKNIHCPHCGTHYTWQVHEKSGFRFLSPPPNTQVANNPVDYGYA